MDKLLALLKPFIKKDLYNAINVHKSLFTLLDVHVSKSMMPNDQYGGTGENLLDMFKKTMDPILANEQFFVEEQATKRVKEELRRGKPKTECDLFGYSSSIFASSKSSN